MSYQILESFLYLQVPIQTTAKPLKEMLKTEGSQTSVSS